MRRLYSPFQFGLRLTLTFIGLPCFLAGGLSAADTPARVLRAGAYAMGITPTRFPVSSSGSMTHRTVDNAHDPLHARCLVLDNGETKIAMVTSDSCMIPREICDGGYETWRAKSSCLAVDAGLRIQESLLKLLNEVAQ